MTNIDLDKIKNTPSDQVTKEDFDAALEAVQKENPAVSIEIRQRLSPLQAAVRMTFDHPGPDNVIELDSVRIGGIIGRAREGQQRAHKAQIREQVEAGRIGTDLDHVSLATRDEDFEQALIRVPNDAAGRVFAKTTTLDKVSTTKAVIAFAVSFASIDRTATDVDRRIGKIYERRQRVANGLGDDLANVDVTLGDEAVAVTFQPVDEALNEVRAIDGARFRKGDKKNDLLDRPHWIVPVDCVGALETALPRIDAAVREANAEREHAREAGRKIAQRIQGQQGPVTVEHDEDKDALIVSFPKDPAANDEIRRAGGRFDRERTAWRVPLEKAEALEERLPEIQEIAETAEKREREAAEARAQQEADRKARQAEFKRHKDVVLGNIDQPSGADAGFMNQMARVVEKNGIARANDVHAYRSLVNAYPDYVEALGLPTDLRNNRARRSYQDGRRAREAEAFVEEKYVELQNANKSDANEKL